MLETPWVSLKSLICSIRLLEKHDEAYGISKKGPISANEHCIIGRVYAVEIILSCSLAHQLIFLDLQYSDCICHHRQKHVLSSPASWLTCQGEAWITLTTRIIILHLMLRTRVVVRVL